MVLIRARYLLVEIGQEPRPNVVGVQAREPDCGCELVILLGCKINPDEKPPKGYKCNCRYDYFVCSGFAIPCSDPDSKGCSGCAEKECCSDEGWNGDCNGYTCEPNSNEKILE